MPQWENNNVSLWWNLACNQSPLKSPLLVCSSSCTIRTFSAPPSVPAQSCFAIETRGAEKKSFCLQEKVWAYVTFSYPPVAETCPPRNSFHSFGPSKNDIWWKTKIKLKTTFFWSVAMFFFSQSFHKMEVLYSLLEQNHILWVIEPNRLETSRIF